MKALCNMNSSIFAATLRGVWIALVCTLLPSSGLWSQNFQIYNINTDNFPRIRADYIALDPNGTPYENLTAADFNVTENITGRGPVSVNPTVKSDCRSIEGDPSASIVLVIDNSSSMSDKLSTGLTRLRYVQNAVIKFLQTLKWTGKTSVSILRFAGDCELVCDWKFEPQELIDSVNRMFPAGATKYELPFEQPHLNVFKLLSTRNPEIPKFVYFLTDGEPNPLMDEPQAFAERVIKEALKQAIRIIGITIPPAPNTHSTIAAITQGTGGKAILTNETNLVDLYALLALETQIRKICFLEWIAPYACNEAQRERTVEAVLKKGSSPKGTTSYLAPLTALGAPVVSDPVLFCGDPPSNGFSVATVTITAKNSPLQVTAIPQILPSTQYFSVSDYDFPNGQTTFTPFTIAPGQSRTIQVRLAQGSERRFRQAILQFVGNPCPPQVTLIGGTGVVLLTSPNGGEVFSSCDEILIQWAGVRSNEPVDIFYSSDGGASWNVVKRGAIGYSYAWTPPQQGNNYKIRVVAGSKASYQWVTQFDGTGSENHASIAVTPNGLRVFVAGWFSGQARFGATAIDNTIDNTDGFLCQLSADGDIARVFHLRGSGNNDERITGVVTDRNGDVYVTGYYTSPFAELLSTGFTLNMNLENLDTRNLFLIKFNADGTLAWSAFGKGTPLYRANTFSNDLGVRYNATTGQTEIVVIGRFIRYVNLGRDANFSEVILQTNDNNERTFFAIFDSQGRPISAQMGNKPGTFTYMSDIAKDNGDCEYTTGSFTGTKTFGNPVEYSLTSRGSNDVWVTKFCSTPPSEDQSEQSFTVAAPKLSTNTDPVVLGSIAQGQSHTQSFTEVCNTGNFRVEILSLTMEGPHKDDFKMLGTYTNVTIDPGLCLPMEIVFTPSGVGVRTATLKVIGTCGTVTNVNLRAEGLPPCNYDVLQLIEMNPVPQGIGSTRVLQCLFRNNSPVALTIEPTLVGTHAADFTITPNGPFTVQPGLCVQDLALTLLPTAEVGLKSARIIYNLPSECGVPITDVTAEVAASSVVLTPVNFGLIRVLNPANDVMKLTNMGEQAIEVTAISVNDPADLHLTVTLPTTPFNVQPSQSIDIPVAYSPKGRGNHEVTVTANVRGLADPVYGKATGTGYLPAIRALGHNFAPIPVGTLSPENGFVRINNADAASPLHIESVAFAALTADFRFKAPGVTLPATIPPGQYLDIPVDFQPVVRGIRQASIEIKHDGRPGPEPFPPYPDTVVIVSGEGLSTSDIDPVEFGGVLTCDFKEGTFTIDNPGSQPFMISAYTPGGADAAYFTISPPAPVRVDENSSRTLTVRFSPTDTRIYSASFVLENAVNPNLRVDLAGEGRAVNATLQIAPIHSIEIGKELAIPIGVNIPAMGSAMVDNFSVTLTYSDKTLGFLRLANPSNANYTITQGASSSQHVTFDFVRSGANSLTTGALFTPVFTVFLNDESDLLIRVDADFSNFSCVVPVGTSKTQEIKQVCGSATRVVRFGSSPFAMETPNPNPTSGNLTVPFSIGFEASVIFELLSSTGRVVQRVELPTHQAGEHELMLNLGSIGSGIYQLRMISGPFVGTSVLSIVR